MGPLFVSKGSTAQIVKGPLTITRDGKGPVPFILAILYLTYPIGDLKPTTGGESPALARPNQKPRRVRAGLKDGII
jgi:hypothetical protein